MLLWSFFDRTETQMTVQLNVGRLGGTCFVIDYAHRDLKGVNCDTFRRSKLNALEMHPISAPPGFPPPK